VDNNEQLGNLSPEIDGLQLFSESQIDENQLSNAAKGSSCHKRCVAWYATTINLKLLFSGSITQFNTSTW
jgi:hypothetical protein